MIDLQNRYFNARRTNAIFPKVKAFTALLLVVLLVGLGVLITASPVYALNPSDFDIVYSDNFDLGSNWAYSSMWVLDPPYSVPNYCGTGNFAYIGTDTITKNKPQTLISKSNIDLTGYKTVILEFNTTLMYTSGKWSNTKANVFITNAAGQKYTVWTRTKANYDGVVAVNISRFVAGNDSITITFQYQNPPNKKGLDSYWEVDDVKILGSTSTNSPVSEFNFESTSNAVNENIGSIVLNVIRSGNLSGTATVDYMTYDNTAIAGENYVAASGTLTFLDSETIKPIPIIIIQDGVYSPFNKNFSISLKNPTGNGVLGTDTEAEVDIIEMDTSVPFVQFSLPEYYIYENETVALINVTRTNDLDSPVSVDYYVSDGIAISGTDYSALNGTLTFNAGEMLKNFTITIYNNDINNSVKTVNLELNNPSSGATTGLNNVAILYILDDDPAKCTYHLVEGWNLISLPFEVADNSVPGVFPAEVQDNMLTFWGWNELEQNWVFYGTDPDDWYYTQFPDLTSVEPGHGYWVEMAEGTDVTFTITGTSLYDEPNIAPVNNGWTLMGPLYQEAGIAPAVMYPDAFTVWEWNADEQNWVFYGADPEDWYYTQFSPLTELHLGQGTWVEMIAD